MSDHPPVDESELGVAIASIAARHAGQPGALLPILHAIVEEFGFVDDRAVPLVAAALNLSRAEVHGVVTFYHDFRRSPPASHRIQLCRAEACQARGAARLEQSIAQRLGIAMGEARADGHVALEPVYCLGLCAIGPNALVDGRPVSRIDDARIDRIITAIGA